MVMAAILVMWSNFFLTVFLSHDLGMLHMKFGWNWLNGLVVEDVYKLWTDGRTDAGRWVITIAHPELSLRWAKNKWQYSL